MKVVTVVGARPQFIKTAVVSRAFANTRSDVKEVLVHTGQHYDVNMSDIFFEEMSIKRPDYSLGVGGGTHGQNTGRMLEKLEALMIAEKPDWVLVYGDTDSTLAGALAAAKLNIPVAHVEAGLRSFNRRMPEETNRVLTDHVSTFLFAPTQIALRNLINEGISDKTIHMVGDVMYDAALFYKSEARKPVWFDSTEVACNEFVLCTIHRAENTDSPERMQGILRGLAAAEMPVILPLHPRTRTTLEKIDCKLSHNIKIVEPVGYFEMIWLEMNCKIVATDSGGVQKEAYFHQKRCVTLRDETEWVELVDSGLNLLVGANAAKIAAAVCMSDYVTYSAGLYGDGAASEKIVKCLGR